MNKVFIGYNLEDFDKKKICDIGTNLLDEDVAAYKKFGKLQLIFSKKKQNKFYLYYDNSFLLNICGVVENKKDLCVKYKCDNFEEFLFETFKKSKDKIKEVVKSFSGQFVIFFYDKKKDEITTINDKLGLYSAYIHEDKNSLIYSSKAEAILPVKKDLLLNHDAISDYLILGAVQNRESFVTGINNLQKATFFKKRGKEKSVTKEYYKFSLQSKTNDEKNMLSRINNVFQKVIMNQSSLFEGDLLVPLTGGFDTRLINSILINNNIETKAFFSKKAEKFLETDTEKLSFKTDSEISNRFAKSFNLKYKIINNSPETSSKFFNNITCQISGLFGGQMLGGESQNLFISNPISSYLKTLRKKQLFSSKFMNTLNRDSVNYYLNKIEKIDTDDEEKKKFVYKNELFSSPFILNIVNFRNPNWQKPNNYYFDNINLYPYLNNDFVCELYKIPMRILNERSFYHKFYAKYYKKYCQIEFLHALGKIYKYDDKRKEIYLSRKIELKRNKIKTKKNEKLDLSKINNLNEIVGFSMFNKKLDETFFHNIKDYDILLFRVEKVLIWLKDNYEKFEKKL